jgi:hypothetical protein
VFYGAIHDTSQLIKIHIQSMVNVKSQLEGIGVKVDNDSLKDIILMNLNDSFNGIRTSLLTKPTELSFDTIHSILGEGLLMATVLHLSAAHGCAWHSVLP